jgi:membrane-bound lytic murein transglycosylase D
MHFSRYYTHLGHPVLIFNSFITQNRYLGKCSRGVNGGLLLCAISLAFACIGEARAASSANAPGQAVPAEVLPEPEFFGLLAPFPPAELHAPIQIPQLPEIDLLQEPTDVWAELRKGFSMPELDTAEVKAHEKVLLKNPNSLASMLRRSEPYIYFIAQECERRGMPAELALVPFVESQFNPLARSPASAVGLWQFIPSTGRQYDLKQNRWMDERRDLRASTRAALDYLTYLHRMHNDWHLALASYNWGEGSVLRAMKRAQDAGLEPRFENLAMPSETRQYVPKLQALKNLIQDPQKYGIELPHLPNKPYFAEIRHHSDVDLREIARLADVELELIRKLNPALNQPVLYADQSDTLLVPVEHFARIQASLDQYKAPEVHRSYRVRKGDSLAKIALRFNVMVKDLKRLNRLGSKERLRPGTDLLVPGVPRSSQWSD